MVIIEYAFKLYTALYFTFLFSASAKQNKCSTFHFFNGNHLLHNSLKITMSRYLTNSPYDFSRRQSVLLLMLRIVAALDWFPFVCFKTVWV